MHGVEGKLVKKWAGFGEKSHVTGLAVRGEEIFVADAGRRMILRCDLEGKVLAELKGEGGGGLVLPSAFLKVVALENGELLVNNPGRHRVEFWNSDGKLLRYWGQAGVGATEFIGCCNPSQLAVTADGRIIVAEKGATPRVRVYTADGELEAVVAGPKELGRAPDGFEVVYSALGGGEEQILVMEPGGTEVRVFGKKKS